MGTRILNYIKRKFIIIAISSMLVITIVMLALSIFTSFIGVVTALIGILSALVGMVSAFILYKTFSEQRDFNTTQRQASDWAILTEMKNMIDSSSNSVELKFNHSHIDYPVTDCVGLKHINILNNPRVFMYSADFKKLYNAIKSISDLCILFHNVNGKSSLSNEIKQSFEQAMEFAVKQTYYFFTLCSRKESFRFKVDDDTAGDQDHLKDKQETCRQYIQELENHFPHIANIHNIPL